MSNTARTLLLVTSVSLGGLLFGGAPQDCAGCSRLSQAAIAAPVRPPNSDIRIWYSPDDYPQLALPDGKRETVRSILNITKPMRFGDFVWNEDRIPAGRVWVRIDLAKQLLSVFRGGHEIGSAVILYGSDGKASPTGNFTILEKNAHYYSHTYDAPMPYMLRLTHDGVAIHGSNVREGWATHGCIGVPLNFARLLFAAAKKGDPVVIMPAQSGTKKT